MRDGHLLGSPGYSAAVYRGPRHHRLEELFYDIVLYGTLQLRLIPRIIRFRIQIEKRTYWEVLQMKLIFFLFLYEQMRKSVILSKNCHLYSASKLLCWSTPSLLLEDVKRDREFFLFVDFKKLISYVSFSNSVMFLALGCHWEKKISNKHIYLMSFFSAKSFWCQILLRLSVCPVIY